MEDSGKEWALKQEKIVSQEIYKWFALVIICLLTPILLLMIDVKEETTAVWFQRSGSVMVALALLADIRVIKIDRLIIARDHSFLYTHIYIEQKYNKKLNFVRYMSYLLVAIGTVIWGYGDLLYHQFIG